MNLPCSFRDGILPICAEYGVDREFHATAGLEAGATLFYPSNSPTIPAAALSAASICV